MKLCYKCSKGFSVKEPNTIMCHPCHEEQLAIIDKQQARILELELELQNLLTRFEPGIKLRKMIWGDDFNDESLH